jgi:uncharacterized membrane protein
LGPPYGARAKPGFPHAAARARSKGPSYLALFLRISLICLFVVAMIFLPNKATLFFVNKI